MKCQIQWIGPDGKPTPDQNEAVAMAHIHQIKIEVINQARGEVRATYLPEIAQSFPICADHLDMVKDSWLYTRGGGNGGWEFTDYAVEYLESLQQGR